MKKYLLPLLAVGLLTACGDSKKDKEISELKEQVAYLKGAADQQAKQDSAAAAQQQAESAPAADQAKAEPAAPAAPAVDNSRFAPGKDIFFYGSISTYDDAQINVTAGSGTATFGGQERQVKFESYTPSTGQLVYKAYLHGSYIGKYVGTYRNGGYNGTFHNSKTGGKVSFHLTEFCD